MSFTAILKGSGQRISFKRILVVFFFSIYFSLFTIIDLPKAILDSNSNKEGDIESSNILQDVIGISDFIFSEKTELKEHNDLTALLIIGIDTRNAVVRDGEYYSSKGTDNNPENTRNTDTIMQAVYDHATGNIFMISIPRDMGIDINKDCLKFRGAINQSYLKGQAAKCEGGGLQVLKDVVEMVTGIKSQYHVFISLDVFQEIIDTLGEENNKGEVGIYVNNPKDVWDVYPNTWGGWENVFFPKGNLFLTPYRALQYARARQYTSDFERARRQQLIVEACLKRVLTTDILLDIGKLNELLGIYKRDVVFSEPESMNELMNIVDVVQNIDTSKIYHMVLDPEFGGHEVYINKYPHDKKGPYYMVPTAWKECGDNDFCKVNERIEDIILDPQILN